MKTNNIVFVCSKPFISIHFKQVFFFFFLSVYKTMLFILYVGWTVNTNLILIVVSVVIIIWCNHAREIIPRWMCWPYNWGGWMGASPPILNGLTMPLESCSHKVRERVREADGDLERLLFCYLLFSRFYASFLFFSFSVRLNIISFLINFNL